MFDIHTGWSVHNGCLYYPDKYDRLTAFRFVQEALYDGHVPTVRAIGYHLITPSKGSAAYSKKVVKRFAGCADDRLSLVANFSKLLFVIDPKAKRVCIEESKGIVNVSTAEFLVSMHPVRVISTQDYLYTALLNVSAELAVSLGTGYVPADVNYETIHKSSTVVAKTRLFPMYSYHALVDFVNILPPVGDDNVLHLVYYYGMTDEIFADIFKNVFLYKIDKEWCAKYKEILC